MNDYFCGICHRPASGLMCESCGRSYDRHAHAEGSVIEAMRWAANRAVRMRGSVRVRHRDLATIAFDANELVMLHDRVSRGPRPREGGKMMTPELREAIDRANELDRRWCIEETLRRCTGIARAHANYRASHPPEQLWALHDDEHNYTVFGSLEDALADRANEEHTTATVTPVCIAMPTIDGGDLIDKINECSVDDLPCDFGIDTHDGPFGGPCTAVIELDGIDDGHVSDVLTELTEALSNAFATWARKHVGFAERGKASIQAWNFTGPARRFERYFEQGPGPYWRELCPRTIGHGIHNCTLPPGHAGDCDPEV